MIAISETFAVKPVAALKNVTGEKLGYQLKLINTTPKTIVVNKYQFGPGIADAALDSDPIFPSAEAALAAWESHEKSFTAKTLLT